MRVPSELSPASSGSNRIGRALRQCGQCRCVACMPCCSQAMCLGAAGLAREAVVGAGEDDGRAGEGRRLQRLVVDDLSLIHISEPTRLLSISYAVFCLKKKI